MGLSLDDLKLLEPFLTKALAYSQWINMLNFKDVVKNLEGTNYLLKYSKKKPKEGDPFTCKGSRPMIRIGMSCGKGFGRGSDTLMDDTYRVGRRGFTSQPLDRISDHMVIMRDGPESNMFKKNLAGTQKAWSPVFQMYGFGKELLKNTWIKFAIPINKEMDFTEAGIVLGISELVLIGKHKAVHNGKSPITDLKYANKTQEEIQQIAVKEYGHLSTAAKGRLTKIQNNPIYKNLIVDNKDFRWNLETANSGKEPKEGKRKLMND